MKKQGNMFQTKEQDKSSETDLKEMDISDLHNKEFNITIIRMLTEVSGAIHEQSENFNKEIENIKKYQTVCTSLMTGDIEHLLICLLAICMSCLEKCLFRSTDHFLNWIIWGALGGGVILYEFFVNFGY